MYDLLIKEATIIDGTQTARFFGDIAIRDGIVERIDGHIPAARARQVIDAAGLIVAPGVVDSHTHYDAPLFWDPYASNTGWHGGTTVAIGNCGFGFAPCARDRIAQDRIMQMMEHTEQISPTAMRLAMDWDWESFPQWIDRLRRLDKAVNVAAHVPLNVLMAYVMTMEEAKRRTPTRAEMDRMKFLLDEAMEAGAIGFAFTFQGDRTNHVDFDGSLLPTDAMKPEVAFELAEVLRDRGHGCIQINCDKVGHVDNRFVAEEVARVSGQRVIYNTLAYFPTKDGEDHVSRLKWLDDMNRQGLNIYGQGTQFRHWVEFTALDTNMWDPVECLRAFSVAPNEEKVRLAADDTFRSALRDGYDPDAMGVAGGPFERYLLVDSAGAANYADGENLCLGEIAKRENVPVTDLFMDLIARSGGKALFRNDAEKVDPEVMADLLRNSRAIAGTSDGGAHSKFWAGGYYATDQIKWFSRETGVLDLELLHNRFSLLPARALGLNRRGALLEGWAADLYIYDHERIDYPPAFEKKHDLPGNEWRVDLPSIGIEWTIVNGEPTLRGMAPTGVFPGRLVGNGGADIDAHLAAPLPCAAE